MYIPTLIFQNPKLTTITSSVMMAMIWFFKKKEKQLVQNADIWLKASGNAHATSIYVLCAFQSSFRYVNCAKTQTSIKFINHLNLNKVETNMRLKRVSQMKIFNHLQWSDFGKGYQQGEYNVLNNLESRIQFIFQSTLVTKTIGRK